MLQIRPYAGISYLRTTLVKRLSSRKRAIRIQKAGSTSIRAKLKVDLITIGKRSGKDAVFDAPVAEYTKRMSNKLFVSERSVKREDAVDLVQLLAKSMSVMLMDENGKMPRDSVHFADMIFDALERGGSRLAVLVGDADGLPAELAKLRAPRIQMVSLSPLTFTHKMIRLFIYEQLYRATQIKSNTKYHK